MAKSPKYGIAQRKIVVRFKLHFHYSLITLCLTHAFNTYKQATCLTQISTYDVELSTWVYIAWGGFVFRNTCTLIHVYYIERHLDYSLLFLSPSPRHGCVHGSTIILLRAEGNTFLVYTSYSTNYNYTGHWTQWSKRHSLWHGLPQKTLEQKLFLFVHLPITSTG